MSVTVDVDALGEKLDLAALADVRTLLLELLEQGKRLAIEQPFENEVNWNDGSPRYNFVAILNGRTILIIDNLNCHDVTECMIKATYDLDGDGPPGVVYAALTA
jgi:hypothetical protein